MMENIILDCGDFCNMMDWGHMSWWGFPFFGFLFIGILIAIIIIVYVIIHSEKSEEKEIISDAQRFLDERYAKGEMTRKEYLQAKEDIERMK